MNRVAEGELLAGYERLAEIGRGAASTVHRVCRPGTDQPYALKILDSDSADAEAAFRREAVLLAGVNHPGLMRIHEVGSVGGRAYLVMDLIDGQTLARVLTDGPLPPSRVIELALDLADPLAAAHRAGLVHRDLKPHNVMVRPDGRAQLIDFGLAARASGRTDGGTVGTTHLRGAGAGRHPAPTGRPAVRPVLPRRGAARMPDRYPAVRQRRRR